MRQRFFSTLLLALAAAAALISGCQKASATDRILVVANLADPEYLDPGLATGTTESNIIRNIFEGLTAYDSKTAEPVPALAESWTVSADQLTYTFRIRKNANWSDGTPVTAADFAYSWERLLNPKTGARYAMMLFPIKGAQEYNSGKLTDPGQLGFRVINDKTLEVTLNYPIPYFLEVLAHETSHAVPKWVVEKFGEKWCLPEHVVVNGAFLLTSWIPQREILLAKNPAYWDADNVKLAGVRFLPLEDKQTALKKYEADEVDIVLELPPIKVPDLMGREDFYQASFLRTYFYRLNVTRPPLNDKRVRQALAMAIDRDVIANSFLKHQEIPTTSMVPKGLRGYEPIEGLTYNPAAAKKLLAEAGFPNGENFPKMTILFNTDEKNRLVAQVIQQMWKKILGIDVGLYNQEWKTYLKTLHGLDYDIGGGGWTGDYLDPNTFLDMFATGSDMNETGWKSEKFDALIKATAKEIHREKRLTILQKSEQILLEEAAVLPIYTFTKKYMKKSDVHGFYGNLEDIHPYKDVYFSQSSLWKKIVTKK